MGEKTLKKIKIKQAADHKDIILYSRIFARIV